MKRWVPKLAAHVDYSWRAYAGEGEQRQLHVLARRWPLAYDGFEVMHDMLVAAGADATFRYTPQLTSWTMGETVGMTAKQVYLERCRQSVLEMEEQEDEEEEDDEITYTILELD